MTRATYDAVANHFRKLWGREAGWAHSVLFAADLRAFSDKVSTTVEVKEEQVTPTKKPLRAPDTPESLETPVTKSTSTKRSRISSSAMKVEEVVITNYERVKRRRRG